MSYYARFERARQARLGELRALDDAGERAVHEQFLSVNTDITGLGVHQNALSADPYVSPIDAPPPPSGSPVDVARPSWSGEVLLGLRVWPVWKRVFPKDARGVDGEKLDFLPMRTGWFQCPLTRLWGPATTVVCKQPFSCILCFNKSQEQAKCACGPHGDEDDEDMICCACGERLLRQ